MSRDYFYTVLGILGVFLAIWVLVGLVINLAEQEQCKRRSAHSYAEITVVPVYYAYWIGCELSEPRFN